MKEEVGKVESNIFGSLQVYKGMTEPDIQALIHYAATDQDVHRFTSDKTRFQARENYDTWVKNVPNIYTLKNEKGEMVGIIWFEAMKLIDPRDGEEMDITFGIRTYGEARGKGLAGEFMKAAFDSFKASETYHNLPNKRIWLKTSQDNIPAVRAYEKFGFEKVGEPDQKNKILMIL